MSNYDDFNIQLDNDIAIDEQKAQKQASESHQKAKNNPYSNDPQNAQDVQVGSSDYDLSRAAHPIACVATFAFKAVAFTFYMIGGFMSTVFLFIFVTVIGAMDFWVVKNVTGRLLVGLRWWSDYDENGKEIWKFQSYNTKTKSNPVDKAFFWTSQLGFTILWAVFLIIKILSLSPFWAFLVFINLLLCGINLYGYYKCHGDHNKKIQDVKKAGMKKLVGGFFS